MVRGALLRSIINKKFRGDCPIVIDGTRSCILVTDFVAEDQEGKERKVVNPGDEVTIRAKGSLRITDRVADLRVHPVLYECGVVFGSPKLSPIDGDHTISFTYIAKKRTDLKKLDYFCELYIGD